MPRFRLHRDAYRDALRVGRLSIEFQRTLRIPDDGTVYPLPPGLGTFPIRRVRDYARRVPASWRERGGYFVPMYQREALWILFRGPDWRLNAVKVGVETYGAAQQDDEPLAIAPWQVAVSLWPAE